MCRELDALRQSVVAFATGFDPHALIPAQAAEVVRACAQMEASISSVKALAMARAAESRDWKAGGFRSAEDQLAQTTGTSQASARRAIRSGRRMAKQPEVAKAALAGELSAEQAAAVSQGVAANPAKAGELIALAKQGSMGELMGEVSRAKAVASDLEARRRRIHDRRLLRSWTDPDGVFHGRLDGNPEDGITLWGMLDPIRRRLNLLRRAAGTTDRFDALNYDALITVARVATGQEGELTMRDLIDIGLFPEAANPVTSSDPPPDESTPGPSSSAAPSDPEPKRARKRKFAGSPVKVIVRIDLDTLLRGVPVEGEVCEIDGYGPVPVSVVEDLTRNGNVVLAAALTRFHSVLGVYHPRRRPNAHQQTALEALYPTCAAEGCTARAALQNDHRLDWARTKYTVFDLMDRLCPHHHRLKTQSNWALVDGSGKRPFVPPEDSRHPYYGVRGSSPPTPRARSA